MSTRQTTPLPQLPPPGPPPGPGSGARPRRSPAGWLLVLVGALLAALLAVSGAASAVTALARQSASGGEVVDGVSAIEVRNDCAGDVDVSATSAATTGAADVRWRDSWALQRPTHRQSSDGGRLLVEVDCSGLLIGPGPSSDLVLVVPGGAVVEVETGSGDVSASGLSAPLTLTTGSGDVDVEGATGGLSTRTGSGDIAVDEVGGDVRARTGSGSVRASGMASDAVEVTTGSGDVRLAATAPPQQLTGRSGSGDVVVELPDDARGYAVEVATGSGDSEVGVVDDPASSRVITLRTGSGDVTVVPAP